MKKIYLIATFLGATSLAFNQVQELPMRFSKSPKGEKAISENTGAFKAAGQTLWSSDFSNVSEWTIGNGTGGNQGSWQIGPLSALTDTNYYAPLHSTSGGNMGFFIGIGYLLNPPVLTQNSWLAMSNVIDATGETMLTFSFEQSYRAFNHDETIVEVSLDGGSTWEQSQDVNSAVAVNTSSPNAVIVRNFTVNGSNSVKFRFRWSSMTADNSYGSGYAWQVDDVKITTLSDNDISTSALDYGSNVTNNPSSIIYYRQIPVSQTAPITSEVALLNEGTQTQTGVVFNAYETLAGSYSSSSAPKTITSGSSDTAAVANAFTPPSTGAYRLEYGINADQVDDVPSNNIIPSYNFRVTQHLYARDNSTTAEIDTGAFTGGYYTYHDDTDPNLSQVMEIGNVFHIFQTTQVYGVEFKIGAIYSQGSIAFGHILDDNLTLIPGAETEHYTVQNNDDGKYVVLKFPNPITLQPGEYVVTATCFDPEFSVAASGVSPAQTSFVYAQTDDTWYYVTTTPIVRMNLDPNIGCAQSPAFTYGGLENVCLSGGNSFTPVTVLNSGGTWAFATSPSDGATINASTGEVSNATAGTTYMIQYDLGGGCAETRAIVVNSYPTVSVTSSDPTLCVGNSTTLTASGATNYYWGVDMGTNPVQNISPATTTSYSVIGYNGACRDTATIQVTVNPYDDGSFSFPSFCASSTTYNVASNVATPGGTFTFNPAVSDGATIDPSTGEITGAVAGTAYNVEYTTGGACPTTTSVMVTPTNHDNASFIFDDACVGEAMVPSGIVTANGTFSFESAPSDGAAINASTGEITNASQGTSYNVVYTTPAGSCQWSDTVTVTMYDLPTISITPANPAICAGESVELTAAGGDSYLWANLGGGASKDVAPSATTVYTVTGTDANGCSNTSETTVTVNPLPSITFADAAFCDTITSVEMTAQPVGGVYSGVGVSGTTFDPQDAGIGQHPITYTYTDSNTGCENSEIVDFTVQACLGIAIEELNGVVVSPNPTSDYFQVSTIGNNQIKEVQLVSIQGDVIPVSYTKNDEYSVEVNVSKVASGTYFIKLNTQNGQLTKKIVVQ